MESGLSCQVLQFVGSSSKLASVRSLYTELVDRELQEDVRSWLASFTLFHLEEMFQASLGSRAPPECALWCRHVCAGPGQGTGRWHGFVGDRVRQGKDPASGNQPPVKRSPVNCFCLLRSVVLTCFIYGPDPIVFRMSRRLKLCLNWFERTRKPPPV